MDITAGRSLPAAVLLVWATVLFGCDANTNAAAAGKAGVARRQQLERVMAIVKPLHKQMGPPQPGDWLLSHKEPGQSFAQYLASNPRVVDGKRRVIYVQPLGEFTQKQREIVKLSADFMGRYFGLPVKVKDDLPLSVIPDEARRTHPTWRVKQILSTYVLGKVLKPRLPADAAAYIAFTSSDLWPGEGWNFVFGQASLRNRVGVWSIYRNGDPAGGADAFRLCLIRTLKTATHETGHMFSLSHCTAYECNMCGSNNREESDRRPLALCPECLAKVCWATGNDPLARYKSLLESCRKQGLKDEAAFYQRTIDALTAAQ